MESISNPQTTEKNNLTFPEIRAHIDTVIQTFPKGFKLVKENVDSCRIVYLEKYPQFDTVPGDVIITATEIGNGETKYEASNEIDQMRSYGEQQKAEYCLSIFIKLVNKAIDGSLISSLENNKKNQQAEIDGQISSLRSQQTINYVILAVAIVLVIFGIKMFLR